MTSLAEIGKFSQVDLVVINGSPQSAKFSDGKLAPSVELGRLEKYL